MKKILFLIIVGVGTILAATAVPANALIFELDEEYTGGAEPLGPSPWLTATFDDIGDNQVRLTLDASGLSDDEFVSGWYFNFNFAVSPDWFAPAVDSGPSYVIGSGIGSNNYNAGGTMGHGFDIFFQFETADNSDKRFTAGEVAVYTLELPAGTSPELIPESFNLKNEAGYFYSAAHVQDIDNPDFETDSGWIGAERSIAAIPEPATIILIGTGLASLFCIRRFRFRNN